MYNFLTSFVQQVNKDRTSNEQAKKGMKERNKERKKRIILYNHHPR